MIKAVLFDMDGILFDSEDFYMQGTIAQMKSWGYNGPIEKIYAIIGTSMEGTCDILYQLLDGKKPKEDIAKENYIYFTQTNPLKARDIMFQDVPKALETLKNEGIQMAVCSSSPYETVMYMIKEMGIQSYFNYIESGEHLAHFKPAPDIYLDALKQLNVKVEEAIVYEDSQIGIQAGKNAGMITIAREDLRYGQDQSQADFCVKNISELVKWIEGVNHGESH
ncbi:MULTISPECIES: HAD family phosphatase [Terrabacteria group]|uniref:HAD family hydrolase n=1 Tax=Bacillati TaxID=1783272 RepID=UPI0019397B7B|nr:MULTISPECIES: HAD family phosphatase [Terrabacteria group]MBW9212927.1 HAD family phosphatase [Trueperella sp. zg.1013]QRG86987.1 HAD family phosphatase [Bulleidia sp. zg-1006]